MPLKLVTIPSFSTKSVKPGILFAVIVIVSLFEFIIKKVKNNK